MLSVAPTMSSVESLYDAIERRPIHYARAVRMRLAPRF